MLAYSTVSQIGYMFLAVGLGPVGYALGILHLLAHGFFKAGLFLGAGSVMHGMNDEVDMRRFGGLWKRMPMTFGTFGLGYLALIGFPFLSGLLHQGRDHRGRLRQGLARGWMLGGRALLGAGAHGVLHDPADGHDLLRQGRWGLGPRTAFHPHESPAGDDACR